MKRKIRVGILGAYRGLDFTMIMLSDPNVELFGICDNNEERIENLKKGKISIDKKILKSLPEGKNLLNFEKERLERLKEISKKQKIQYFTDFDKFIENDFDALFVANYCTEHAPYAIKGLKSGKHVLSEIIPCKTLAEAVELCREVEKAEKNNIFYMLGANCCYWNVVLKMKKIYNSGKIGQIRYGEGEYICDMSRIWYYFTSDPSHWRNWLPATYYIQHALGPFIEITNLKPVEVTGFVVPNLVNRTFGRKGDDWGILIIKLENDAILRIIPWSTAPTKQNRWIRIYGIDGMMECGRWDYRDVVNVVLKKVFEKPKWKTYKLEEDKTLNLLTFSEFIKSIRKKERPPIDIYKAMDMSLPGIIGYKSVLSGSIPMKIPDFRKEEERKKYENDNWSPDPKDKNLQKNPPPPSILGDIKINNEVYENLKNLRLKFQKIFK